MFEQLFEAFEQRLPEQAQEQFQQEQHIDAQRYECVSVICFCVTSAWRHT